jgi:hypothetical protein
MGDLGIYIETPKEVIDRFEQIHQCVVSGTGALGRLIRIDVMKMPGWELQRDAYGK